MEQLISTASFVVILFGLVYLRSRNANIEIKVPDIIVAVMPAMLFLIATGKLSKFELSESGLKIETAISEAAKSKISGLEKNVHLEKLPAQSLASDDKASLAEIPRLIDQKTEALSFRMGVSDYKEDIIYHYMQELTAKPYLKHLIFLDKEGQFLGISPVKPFVNANPNKGSTYRQLANSLAKGDRSWIEANIPEIVMRENALNTSTSRSEALSKMIELHVDELPVIDQQGDLVGMVERNFISSTLLLEIASKVKVKE
ncbi:CBS domain-containing protein [Aliikangiella maris]|uniref:CBS domain-containing protein n=2 Tax=Aliikangiella maris TaxID=3162458 RepID=A0ABV3MRA2_9GAMM